jgi:amidohydrolase
VIRPIAPPALRRAAAAALLLAGPSTLGAQTTATERTAAGSVLRDIDALEVRLAPTKLAERLATATNPDKQRLLAKTAELWDGGLQSLSDWIGKHPEVGWKEVKAVDTLTAVLKSHGFSVETGVAKLPTAFVATWQSPAGAGPVVGLIAEYDALRDTEGPFHGDQHNAQSPTAFAAAFALQDVLTARRMPATLKIYGTPAEEVGPPAKKIMRDAGVFAGAELIVRSHSSTATKRSRAGFGICCLNINEVKYVFTGRPAHQLTSWNGRNALEAAVQFFTAVNGLRSTFRPEASIQGVIPEAGIAPNVVPARAVVDYYIRYPDGIYLEHISKMMDDAARGAALATGTTVTIDRYGEYRDGVTLGTLEELSFAYARRLGAPNVEPDAERPAGYEETGGVSHDVPGLDVSVFTSRGTYHTKEMEADAFSPVGHTGFRLDAEIMAAVLFDYLTDAEFRQAVKTEHGTLKGLFGQYQENLKKAYAAEMEGR